MDRNDVPPPETVERTGRMHALGGRLVLAMVDRDTDAVSELIEAIAGYDDAPGRRTYPGPRFLTAYQAAFQLADTYAQLAARPGLHADGSLDRVRALARDCAPPAHQEETLRRLDTPAKGQPDAARVLAVAALAASFATQTALFPSQQSMRLTLLRQIRKHEAEAIQVPARERIDVDDEEAVRFIRDLLPGDFVGISHDPRRRDLWELDLLAAAKIFLLEHPASTLTPEQRKAFLEEAVSILEAATRDVDRRRAERERETRAGGAGQRTQPKRKKPRGKR